MSERRERKILVWNHGFPKGAIVRRRRLTDTQGCADYRVKSPRAKQLTRQQLVGTPTKMLKNFFFVCFLCVNPSKVSKVISTSAKSSIVEPVLQGNSAIVQLAGPMGLDHQNIPGCSSWPELASAVRLPRQMQPLHSHLTNTAFVLYAGNRRERDLKKKKKGSLS